MKYLLVLLVVLGSVAYSVEIDILRKYSEGKMFDSSKVQYNKMKKDYLLKKKINPYHSLLNDKKMSRVGYSTVLRELEKKFDADKKYKPTGKWKKKSDHYSLSCEWVPGTDLAWSYKLPTGLKVFQVQITFKFSSKGEYTERIRKGGGTASGGGGFDIRFNDGANFRSGPGMNLDYSRSPGIDVGILNWYQCVRGEKKTYKGRCMPFGKSQGVGRWHTIVIDVDTTQGIRATYNPDKIKTRSKKWIAKYRYSDGIKGKRNYSPTISKTAKFVQYKCKIIPTHLTVSGEGFSDFRIKKLIIRTGDDIRKHKMSIGESYYDDYLRANYDRYKRAGYKSFKKPFDKPSFENINSPLSYDEVHVTSK